MTDTLVERVAQSLWHSAPSNLAGCFRMWNEASDQDKAAFHLMAQAAIKAQASRIAELEGALQPFSDAADEVDDECGSINLWEHPAAIGLTTGDLREARKALSHSSETDNAVHQ